MSQQKIVRTTKLPMFLDLKKLFVSKPHLEYKPDPTLLKVNFREKVRYIIEITRIL